MMSVTSSRHAHRFAATAAGAITAMAILALPTAAEGAAPSASRPAAVSRPTITAPHTAIEGAHFLVTVRIPAPSRASKVILQFRDRRDYDYQSTQAWTTKLAKKVKGHGKVVFRIVADEAHEAWFRAAVSYRGSRPAARSTTARVNYQHWFPLSSFGRYYYSGSSDDFMSFQMAGRSWRGWYTLGVGEARYTLGNGCVRLRATAGLTDDSSDGATGRLTLSTIDPGGAAAVLYASPELTAGRTVAIDRGLAHPYRFAISGQDTTPQAADRSAQPRAYAALGDPEFLCHFD